MMLPGIVIDEDGSGIKSLKASLIRLLLKEEPYASYSDDSIKDSSTHYNGYVLLVQVSVIDKISTMVANSSGSSVFILQSRGLSLSIPHHVCTTLPPFGRVCTNIGFVILK